MYFLEHLHKNNTNNKKIKEIYKKQTKGLHRILPDVKQFASANADDDDKLEFVVKYVNVFFVFCVFFFGQGAPDGLGVGGGFYLS